MASEVQNTLKKIPIIKQLVVVFENIKLPFLEGVSLFDLLEFLYFRSHAGRY